MDYLNRIDQMMNIVNKSSNPMGMLELMAGKDPQLNGCLNMVRAANGNGQAVFMEEARKKGLSDEQISQFLTGLKSRYKSS